ncbi:hypothetical protein PRIPAC_72236 [Pristionchus pacificus]|nr:hypothetical protein PRIPAC_72236 [Pristionchus pacificus]
MQMRSLLLVLAACSTALATLLQQSAAARFNEDTARSIMLPISSAAYSDKPQACLSSQLKTAKLSKQVSLKCDYFKKDTCSGFTFFDETRKVIGIAFRGTSDTSQLIAEITDTIFDSKVDFQDGGKTSKYFNDAFMDTWNGGLGDDFLALAAKYPSYTVWVTGHSLGGALASMAAAHISANKIASKDKIVLYTFGQPRTGDQKYADIHDDLVTAFRVTHSKDIVAHIPPQFMNYEHHTSEVWYDNDMAAGASYVVCGKQEDKRCSDKHVFNTSPDDHTHYYGKEVSEWGHDGCP